MTLTLNFDLLLKKLNLGYNFWNKWGRAFILQFVCLLRRPFFHYQIFWPLTYFWRNLTLAITFETRDRAFILQACIPCSKTFLLVPNAADFDPVPLTLTFDLLLKKFNLDHNFWTKTDRIFILHMCIRHGKIFLSVRFFQVMTLTLTFDLIFNPPPVKPGGTIGLHSVHLSVCLSVRHTRFPHFSPTPFDI